MVDIVLFHKERSGKMSWRKPKSTVHNPKALVYKRYTNIEKSMSLRIAYKTVDGLYWIFDNQQEQFTQIPQPPDTTTIINVVKETVLTYLSKTYSYENGVWKEGVINNGNLLSVKFANIGTKYQTNKYYYKGTFDYMIKGSIDGETSQYIKGNIIPLTSINIKYFNDDINLTVDDLVVIDGRLYSVENPQTTKKMQPKAFNIYFATLNSIL